MMYVSYGSLRNALLILSVIAFTIGVNIAYAATSGTGLEGGQKHSYGPDVEGRSRPGIVGTGMVDAYGNPVIPEEEDNQPRQRLRRGAYGGGNKTKPSSSLPDLPETDAGWKFK